MGQQVQRPNAQSRSVSSIALSAIRAGVRRVAEGRLYGRSDHRRLARDETKERYFRKYEHREPAGAGPRPTGGGRRCELALVGGLTARSDRRSDRWFGNTGGRPPRPPPPAAWRVRSIVRDGVARCGKKELADYYQQAVIEGRILVAAEDTGPSCAAVVGAGGRDPGRGWCQSAAHAGRLDI